MKLAAIWQPDTEVVWVEGGCNLSTVRGDPWRLPLCGQHPSQAEKAGLVDRMVPRACLAVPRWAPEKWWWGDCALLHSGLEYHHHRRTVVTEDWVVKRERWLPPGRFLLFRTEPSPEGRLYYRARPFVSSVWADLPFCFLPQYNEAAQVSHQKVSACSCHGLGLREWRA